MPPRKAPALYSQEGGDPTIDLHGQRVSDARDLVHDFLLREQARGTFSVRIITGTGTGAVKQAIRDLLTGHPAVAAWRPSLVKDAVTLVDLKPPARRERPKGRPKVPKPASRRTEASLPKEPSPVLAEVAPVCRDAVSEPVPPPLPVLPDTPPLPPAPSAPPPANGFRWILLRLRNAFAGFGPRS